MKLKQIIFLVLAVITLSGAVILGQTNKMEYTNKIDPDRMTIVLSVPSVNNDYYSDVYQQIIDFHIAYANTVKGNDNIVVVADKQTMPLLKGKLPDDILLQERIEDIWMRDFTTVIPSNPVQFKYRPSYFHKLNDAIFIQNKFQQFAQRYHLNYRRSKWILDGGNIVDNNKNYAVTTERFLEDNQLTLTEAQQVLQEALGIEYVAIIPYDDDVMGHADGMVMWTEENKLLVNQYDEPFRTEVLTALTSQLPEVVEIVEVPAEFDDSVWDVFASACGVNLNSTVTRQHIYTPLFDNQTERKALELIERNTDKAVHTINGKNVCFMGGSVRCLSWQVQGENGIKLIEAARGYNNEQLTINN